MNKRIRELKDKIWTEEYWTEPNTDRLLPAQLNRFAELIVRECVGKYDEWAEHSTDKTSFAMARHNVQKHFGVKE
jgi:hypothetical protein